MPISLQCPACGKDYRVRDDLIGRRVKCGCGAVMTVTADGGALADMAEQTPAPVRPEDRAPSSPAAASEGESTARRRRRPSRRETMGRIAAGVLSIVYGLACSAVIVLGGMGLFVALTTLALTVAIAVGGVMILIRHPSGPACAGLSCVFLCFFPAWQLMLVFLTAFATANLAVLLAVPVVTVAVFSIPTFIVVWSLKQEAAKKTEWQPPL